MISRRARFSLAAPGALAAVVLAPPASAQVATDGTVGPRFELSGPDYGIGAELGSRAGDNLFHSFERFSLGTGESATFSGPEEIRNVISRVTGGARSDIDGTLRSTLPGADFFFINPAGVMFGPNASLDVQGSFHVSTADELRFSDGAVFSATDPAASSLTVAAPEAFGFLGAQPAAITVDRSTLEVERGEALSIVGGDISASAGSSIRSERGTISLLAPGPNSSVNVSDGAPTEGRGEVDLTQGAVVDARGDGGGSVRIRAGRFVLSGGAIIDASNTGASPAQQSIDVSADEVVLESSLIVHHAHGSGNAGMVRIRAGDVRLSDGAAIGAGSFAEGDAGRISIASDKILISGSGGLFVNSLSDEASGGQAGQIDLSATTIESTEANIQSVTFGGGNAGTVVVEADLLSLIDGAQINVGPFPGSTGSGGLARLKVAEAFLIRRDPAHAATGVFAGAEEGASGDAGSIDIQAGTVQMVGNTRIDAGGRVGRSGEITMSAGLLHLEGGSQIANSSRSAASALVGRNLRIEASQRIQIVGLDEESGFRSGLFSDALGNTDAGNIIILTPLLIIDGGRITTDTTGDARAGSIIISDEQQVDVVIRNEGQIFAGTDGSGAGGDIRITRGGAIEIVGTKATPQEPLRGDITGIFSNVKENGQGQGGIIDISAERIDVRNGGFISTRTFGSGSAGSINIKLTGSLQVDDSLIQTAVTDDPRVVLEANEGTSGGDIVLVADEIEVTTAGSITAQSQRGPGEAGHLDLQARFVTLRSGSITTEAQQSGGGGITLAVSDVLLLTDDSQVTSSIFGDVSGDQAGNITIDPQFLILDDSEIVARANAGDGGNISIDAANLLRSPGSAIDASSRTGITGTVVVSTPEVDLTGGLLVLEVPLVDAASQLRERCAARRDVGTSSFTGVGRGGLPPGPDQPLMSDYRIGPARRGDNAQSGGIEPAPAVLALACGGAL